MQRLRRRRATRKLFVEALEPRRLLATAGEGEGDLLFRVTNTLDAGAGSLRQAIEAANAATMPARIEFAIPTDDEGFIDVDADTGLVGKDLLPDVFRLRLVSPLPALNNSQNQPITLDATTQTGFTGQTNPHGPEIVLDGTGLDGHGLLVVSDHVTVLGFNLQNWNQLGVLVDGDDARIEANYIGTNATGRLAAGNDGGIEVRAARDVAIVGNLLSGNRLSGVDVRDGAQRIDIIGNRIGTDATGAADLGNGEHGVRLQNVGRITVGGNTAADRNVISGNDSRGITMFQSTFITIAGNHIGTNADGDDALANGLAGIEFIASSTLLVGGPTAASRNVISGNSSQGIFVHSSGNLTILNNHIGVNRAGDAAIPNGSPMHDAHGIRIEGDSTNVVIGAPGAGNVISGNLFRGIGDTRVDGLTIQGNFIGTDATGTFAIPNHHDGIGFSGASNVLIGGDQPGEGNVIAANMGSGVSIHNGTNLVIRGNKIGTDVTGNIDMGNDGFGILVTQFDQVTIGGGGEGQGNVIAANALTGVDIRNTNHVEIRGNQIGTNVTGDNDLGNGQHGIAVAESQQVTIGGTAAADGNVVSGNGLRGMILWQTSDATIAGNAIGTNAAGTAAIANSLNGIDVGHSSAILIGGPTAASRNIISGNLAQGISIFAGQDVEILNNHVGVNRAGNAAIPNGSSMHDSHAIIVAGESTNVRIGAPGAGNVISGNSGSFSRGIGGSVVDGLTIQANFIGTDAAGAFAIPNQNEGIGINGASNVMIGGDQPGEGNVIAANAGSGVSIHNGTNLVIRGNKIGTDVTGNIDLGNDFWGILVTQFDHVTVGGGETGQGNIVSGNAITGVEIRLATNVDIRGNKMGTDAAGNADLGNVGHGIAVLESQFVAVGGTTDSDRNIISGNDARGLVIGLSSDVTVAGNHIGANAAGDAAVPNTFDGIHIFDSSAVLIGGPTAECKNVVSGNVDTGIYIGTSDDVSVLNNHIGVNRDGDAALPNGTQESRPHGIRIEGDSTNIRIGAPGAGNVISGNGGRGIGDTRVHGLTIQSNFIGTDATGSFAIPNGSDGISFDGATDVLIGGDDPAEGNVISGNGSLGVFFGNGSDVEILGNKIGTNAAGTTDLGNNFNGIRLHRMERVEIGGSLLHKRNIISGNEGDGVVVDQSTSVDIGNNHIGTNAIGNAAIPNNGAGIAVFNSLNVLIGGATVFRRNVISGNLSEGVFVTGSRSVDIHSNHIGVNRNGDAALPNGSPGRNSHGIHVTGNSREVRIGIAGGGNVISGNRFHGIGHGAVEGLTIQANWIGTDAAGALAIPNQGDGIRFEGASNVLIGGDLAGEGNVIAGNAGHGIFLHNNTFAEIRGNRIGAQAAGAEPLGNSLDGVVMSGDAHGVRLRNNAILGNRSGIAVNTPAEFRQAAPVLSYDHSSPIATMIGTLTSRPNSVFDIEVFHNSVAQAAQAQGQTRVLATTVTTDENGVATFSIPRLPAGTQGFLTATATDPMANTSAFSAALAPLVEGPDLEVLDGGTPIAAGAVIPLGFVQPGGVLFKILTLRNRGTAPLTLQPANIGEGFSIPMRLLNDEVLAAGESTNMIVQFDGHLTGSLLGEVVIPLLLPNPSEFRFTVSAASIPGLRLVKDIRLGSADSVARQFTTIGDMMYFRADDGIYGNELWKTDGTEEGTVLVKDIRPGPQSSGLLDLTEVNGVLYFEADDGIHGLELWRSDGTADGTFLVKDIYPGTDDDGAYLARGSIEFHGSGGNLYFVGNDGEHGFELWRSDGTADGTFLVADIEPGEGSSFPSDFVEFAGEVYFGAYTESAGSTLWKTNGTADGTVMVFDVRPNSTDADYIEPLAVVNGRLLLRVVDGRDEPGRLGGELWSTDGTAEGTTLVRDIVPGPVGSQPVAMGLLDGRLLFSVGSGIRGRDLWITDGTADGTLLSYDFPDGANAILRGGGTATLGDRFYFAADDGIHGNELWQTDGTPLGTSLGFDFRPGAASAFSNIVPLHAFGSRLFFGATDGLTGHELWAWDLSTDSDGDGIIDAIEQAAPHGGDGNSDGVADLLQAHVASLPDPASARYMTIAAPAGSSLSGVQILPPPIAGVFSAGIEFPSGVMEFEVSGLSPGGAAVVQLFVDAAGGGIENSVNANSFYHFAATPQQATPDWSRFLFDGETGAKLLASHVDLYFTDGERGDGDRTSNGAIAFRGAPVADQRAKPWQNPLNPFDVNEDWLVSAADVLAIVNEINRGGNRILPAPLPPTVPQLPDQFLDVSGDNRLSPLDVLLLVNELNSRGASRIGGAAPAGSTSAANAAEGEDASARWSACDASPHWPWLAPRPLLRDTPGRSPRFASRVGQMSGDDDVGDAAGDVDAQLVAGDLPRHVGALHD